MKKLLSIVTLGAVALALPTSGFAAEKKAKPEAAPAATEGAKKPADAKPAAETKPAGEAKVAGEPKPIGMSAKVDAIDAKAKTFTHKNKDGNEIKFVVTDKTEIKNGAAAAKFTDIKVGDTVRGQRLKKSPTEYEVLKIDTIGVAPQTAKKPEGEKKPDAAKKPEEKKP